MSGFSPTRNKTAFSAWPVFVCMGLLLLIIASVFLLNPEPETKQDILVGAYQDIPKKPNGDGPETFEDQESSVGPGSDEGEETGSPVDPQDVETDEPSEDSESASPITNDSTPQQNLETEKPKVSALEEKTADWRYIGYVGAGDRRFALLERMRDPKKKLNVPTGGTLEGVRIEEILKEKIVVALGDDHREIPLTQEAGFDTGGVVVPTELSDSPSDMAEAVYAQTLGRYVAEEPNIEIQDDIDHESTQESMRELAETVGWEPPVEGQTPEEWAEAVARRMAAQRETPFAERRGGRRLSNQERQRVLRIPGR